jgi:hypothetical protein
VKILVYTVSDFKPFAAECVRLLFQNFKSSTYSNVDYLVITSLSQNHLIPKNFEYKTISDDFCSNYIGFLKYSKCIPNGYDAYIYLDSDILYFGTADQLLCIDKNFSIVFEKLKMSNEWFRYKNASQDEAGFFDQTNGLNAGSFCFKDISFTKTVRDLFEKYINGDVHSDARLEQSSFNYAICKSTNFNLSECFDISPIVRLFASEHTFSDDKKLYHFCGFSNEMASKFYKMNLFLNEKKRRNM